MVKVSLSTALPGRARFLDLPQIIQVATLRELIAQETSLPLERLKLVFKGKTLLDNYKDEAASIKLADGDCIVAVVAPKPPPKHVQNRDGFDDDDELRFRAPDSASRFQKWVIQFLLRKLKLPAYVVGSCSLGGLHWHQLLINWI